jgi:hypothetical protein
VLPKFTSGRVRILDNPRLVTQFAALERRTSPIGKDRVDLVPADMTTSELRRARLCHQRKTTIDNTPWLC